MPLDYTGKLAGSARFVAEGLLAGLCLAIGLLWSERHGDWAIGLGTEYGSAVAAMIFWCVPILTGVLLGLAIFALRELRRRLGVRARLAKFLLHMHRHLDAEGSFADRIQRVLQDLCAQYKSMVCMRAVLVGRAEEDAAAGMTQTPLANAAAASAAATGRWSVINASGGGELVEPGAQHTACCESLWEFLASPEAAAGQVRMTGVCHAISANATRAVLHRHCFVPLLCHGTLEGALVMEIEPSARLSGQAREALQVLGAALGGELAQERLRRRMQQLARYDALTGLQNRTQLLERLQQAFVAAQSSRQWGAAILLDLDHFNPINDLYGYAAGDWFLRTIGQRLGTGLRRRDTVARYGGDEFVVVLEDLGLTQEAAMRAVERVVQKLRLLTSDLVKLPAGDVSVSSSLGVALFPTPEQTGAEEVLRQADIALYRSKESGRDGVSIFTATMATDLRRRRAFDQPLRSALAKNEFFLVMQAKCNAQGRIQGAEVLLRWEHPGLGPVSPEVFIPLAEESGAILGIGEWVLRQSCILLAQTAHLNQQYSLSVNVSPRQLRQPGFAALVRSILEETGAPATRLTLEVTEGQFLSRIDNIVQVLEEVRSLGVRISIDDFGTGYSCLFYLQKLPLDELKIDQSFVQAAPKDASHAVLVDAILSITRQLGLDVVAEGVETKAQLEFLAARGCTRFQGFYFGQPQPVLEFLTALHSQNGEAPVAAGPGLLTFPQPRADKADVRG
jgi:diguanylate cyclase (GGDEF)-like protein